MSIPTKSHSLESWVFTKSLDRGSSPKWMTHNSHLIQVHATLQVLNQNGLWHQHIAWESIVMDACLNSFPGSYPVFAAHCTFKIFFFFATKSWEQSFRLERRLLNDCFNTTAHSTLLSVLPAVVYEFTWNCLKSKFSPIMLCRDSPSLSSVTRSSASLTSVARWHTCEGSKGMGRKGRKKKRTGTNVLVCLSPKLCYDKS